MKKIIILFTFIILFFSAISKEKVVKKGFTKLVKSETLDLPAHSKFGHSVSVEESFAAISAPMEMIDSTEVGSVYIYKKEEGNWSLFQKITPENTEHLQLFGQQVKIYGNTMFIGSPRHFEKFGAVYVYEFNSVTWEFKQLIRPENPILFQKFGIDFDFNDHMALVSSTISNEDFLTSGIVYVFEKENGTWIQKEKIVTPESYAPDFFGSSVKIAENNHILIAAPRGNGSANQSGVVYSFMKQNGVWAFNQKIMPMLNKERVLFGNSIDFENNYLLVGCIEANVDSVHCGDASLYHLNENQQWIFEHRFLPDSLVSQDYYGARVRIKDGRVYIGSPKYDKGRKDLDQGTIYVYEKLDDWQLQAQILPEGLADNDHLGFSFDVCENDFIIGSSLDDEINFNSGNAYFHDLSSLLTDVDDLLVADEPKIKISPNPFSDYANIEINVNEFSDLNISVFDLTGKLIHQIYNGTVTEGIHRYIWKGIDRNGSLVANGPYICKILLGKEAFDQTIILSNYRK